jgi:CHAT domain-containing protein
MERDRRDLERLPILGHSELFKRYLAAVGRLAELSDNPKREDKILKKVENKAELRIVSAELDAAIKSIQQVPGYQDFFSKPTLDQLQSKITASIPGVTSSPIGIYLMSTDVNSLALIVQPDKVHPVWLDFKKSELDEILVKHKGNDIVGGYLPGQLGMMPLRGELDNFLKILGEKIIRPIAEVLENISPNECVLPRLIIFIPVGSLALLPLHAATYRINENMRSLLDDFIVSYAPSAQVVGHCRETLISLQSQSPRIFAVGNPLPLQQNLPSLTFARTEVEEIIAMFGDCSSVLYEQQATREQVVNHLDNATHLHFACHGVFNARKPLESALILSHGELLTLADLIAINRLTNVRLSVLSACQTAIIDFLELPEEAIGLPAGFLQIGVAGVIGTLWPVNDLSTALLMIKFYEYHLKGEKLMETDPMNPAIALRRAQLWLRDVTNAELADIFDHFRKRDSSLRATATAQKQYANFAGRDPRERPFAHPYYWAAFAFYGV